MSKNLAGGESSALIPEEFSEIYFSFFCDICEIYYMASVLFQAFFFSTEGCEINKHH